MQNRAEQLISQINNDKTSPLHDKIVILLIAADRMVVTSLVAWV